MVTGNESGGLARARAILAELAGVERTAVSAAEALALLGDVVPPLPPVEPRSDEGPATVEVALAALGAAAEVAEDSSAAARIAEAGAALRSPSYE